MSREAWIFPGTFRPHRISTGFLSWFAMCTSVLAISLLLGGCTHGRTGDPDPQIAWVGDLNQALQLAKVHNKPLMIHFYGDHCPPCRMLEAKAFRNRDLILAVNDNMIAVKVNADQRRDIAQQYEVTRWPTDVYLHADGTLIERGVSNQDPQAYTRTVTRVAQRHHDWALAHSTTRDYQERRDQKASNNRLSSFRSKIFGGANKPAVPVRVTAADWGRETSASGVASAAIPSMQVIDVEKQLAVAAQSVKVPGAPGVEPASELHSAEAVSSQTDRQRQLEILASEPGLGGFCPVALQDYLKLAPESQAVHSPWVPGDEAYSVRHRGRVYRCASAESRERLLRDPDAFTPVFSGCDLVEFAKSGVLVDGKCELGFIEQHSGRVFLFATRESYDEFARNCKRYSTLGDAIQDRTAQGQPPTHLR